MHTWKKRSAGLTLLGKQKSQLILTNMDQADLSQKLQKEQQK
jgi:hypothetical protein